MVSVSEAEIIEKFIQKVCEQVPHESNFIELLWKIKSISDVGNSKVTKDDVDELAQAKEEVLLDEEIRILQEQYRSKFELQNEIMAEIDKLSKLRTDYHIRKLKKEREKSGNQITNLLEKFKLKEKEEYQPKIDQLQNELKSLRLKNVAGEREERAEWIKNKKLAEQSRENFKKIMKEMDEQLNLVKKEQEQVTEQLQYYEEEEKRIELIREKAELEEKIRAEKIHELKVKMARRVIARFIEQNYTNWKKRKLREKKCIKGHTGRKSKKHH